MKKRYSGLMIIFLIIPILMIFLYISNNIAEHSFNQACFSNLQVLKQTKKTMTTFTDDIQFVSISILGNEALQSMMKQYSGESAERDKYMLNFSFGSLLSSRKYIDSISIFDEDKTFLQFGRQVTSENTTHLRDTSELKGRIFWTAAEKYQNPAYGNKNEYVVSLYRAHNDLYSMNRLGYQRISTLESYIASLYEGIADNCLMFIADESGGVISASNKELLGKNISSESYFNKLFASSEGYFENGENVIAFYNIKKPDWCVVKLIPKEKLTQASTAILNVIYICMLLCIVFIIIFQLFERKAIITEQSYKSKLLNRDIELKYLQSQINPHFLYNTLDTIRWMAVMQKQQRIADQIEALSGIFWHTLNSGMENTTVEKEVEHVGKYMLIQQNRFGEKVRYSTEIAEDCLGISVPKLILQPLVENAVVHGLEQLQDGGEVKVKIYRKKEFLYYEISDNGIGFDERVIRAKMNDPKQSHAVFAIKNIDERLKVLYGDEYGIEFSSTPGAGTIVLAKLKG